MTAHPAYTEMLPHDAEPSGDVQRGFHAIVHLLLPGDMSREGAASWISETLGGGAVLDWSYVEKIDPYTRKGTGDYLLPEPVQIPKPYIEGAFLRGDTDRTK